MKLPRARHLSAAALAGQLLMPAIRPRFLNRKSPEAERLLRMVTRQQAGGFILFGGHPADVQYWVNRLQQAAPYPLLIGADLERGAGGIFRSGTLFPHALAWGAADDLPLAEEAARIIAAEARTLGINTLLAPVLDLVNRPDNPIVNIRGFHSSPERTADFGRRFVEAVNREGILCVAKHFPGHGRTRGDSHLELPQIPAGFPELAGSDLLPFRRAIDSGLPGLMSGHLQLADNPLPATFRPDILHDYLRGELRFSGLLLSDSLQMQAISRYFRESEQVSLGLQAGLDIFLMPANPALFHRLLTDAAEKKPQWRRRMEQSADRILNLKKKLHRHQPEPPHPAKIYKFLERPGHAAVARKLAEKSVTCIWRSAGFPLNLPALKNCLHLIHTDFPPGSPPLADLNRDLQDFFPQVRILENPRVFPGEPFGGEKADLVIFSLYSRTFGGHQPAFDRENIRKNFQAARHVKCPVILLVFGNPFPLENLPDFRQADAVLLLWSYVRATQQAAFRALASFIPVQGILPVPLSADGPPAEALKIDLRPYCLAEAAEALTALPEADRLIQQAIGQRAFPGAVLLAARQGEILYQRAYGRYEYQPDWEAPPGSANPAVQPDTVYDLASLTKVLATTPAILKLADEGKIALDDPLRRFFGCISDPALADATIADLLAHQSGLPAWKPFFNNHTSKAEIIREILKQPPEYEPRSRAVYSDPGFMLLAEIVEKTSGLHFGAFCRDRIFHPLGLDSLHFRPLTPAGRIASAVRKYGPAPPTGHDPFRNRIVREEVNDANCAALGGVAGHAGLFGSARDVAAMGQLFLNRGIYQAGRFLRAQTAESAVRPVNPAVSRRALGWDMPDTVSSSGRYFSRDSFGHLAFTGPSLWADPLRNLIVVFLCNRTHPDPGRNEMKAFRPSLHDAVYQALLPESAPGPV